MTTALPTLVEHFLNHPELAHDVAVGFPVERRVHVLCPGTGGDTGLRFTANHLLPRFEALGSHGTLSPARPVRSFGRTVLHLGLWTVESSHLNVFLTIRIRPNQGDWQVVS